ncbi:unnamed protein product [Parascedosporium putredinis]|uniref:CENP-V/GFA domain-containing protein n=1 Tax=Parascedosporium putredinis TaxID=1442378 RepID=A0A9P1H0V5_9PEZI|nr:unnamed protein product [Parascedosporium putredinis]CAI7993150.1 unnamed protein product [Parascedosporium putredinis]
MTSYDGHCNCGGIEVSLPQAPSTVIACHCLNCRRTGGPYSINYIVEESDASIKEITSVLTLYSDKNTFSGNEIVRQFCNNCGSSVLTRSPAFPGKLIVKASLFDHIPSEKKELFAEERAIHWG